MAQQKKGLVARLLEGKERSDEYARSTLPTNRWQLFWDIFKGNFGKMVKVNLLILLFFLPMIAVIVLSSIMSSANGTLYPFSANLAIGYPAAPAQQGIAEMLVLQNDFFMYIGLLVSSLIASLGLAGGMYVMRNMVWTEGVFVSNDFWRGIKLNYKNALQTAIFFFTVLLVSCSLINFADFTIAMGELSGGQKTWLVISQTMSYVFIVVAVMMSFWMIALGVNYKYRFVSMLHNAFLMVIGTLPQTIFFGVLALLPFALLLLGGSFFMMIAILAVLLFAFSYALLVWLDFAQWVFDRYINPKIQGARVNRGIYSKDGSSSSAVDEALENSVEYQRILLSYGKSRLVARPIKPIDDGTQMYELPDSFSREDLKKLRESKQTIIDETEAYAQEHKDELRYVEYNKQFEERERALQDEVDKNGKKKKRKPPKLLGE